MWVWLAMRFICTAITMKNGSTRIPHRLNVTWENRIHAVFSA